MDDDANLAPKAEEQTAERSAATLYEGLQAISDDQFPKTCSTCGRVFSSPADLVAEGTQAPTGHSGLRSGEDDGGQRVVYLFRNCSCGSTLLDSFRDRRDRSPAGLRRRERFGKLIDLLGRSGVRADLARVELLRLLAGERSECLERLGIRIRPRQV
jgi:hypothetical protein